MTSRSQDVLQISAVELKTRLDRGDLLTLLDVREEDERAFCAIPVRLPAVDLHIPMAQIPARLGDLQAKAESAPLIVYCHLGMRSMTVAAWLVRQGLTNVHNLEGGIDAWSGSVDPDVPRY
jgi:rhodanese-related sulfurtransferase